MAESTPPSRAPARPNRTQAADPAYTTLRAAAAVASVLFALACAREPATPQAPPVVVALADAVVTQAPALVVPDHRWSPTECSRWSFRGFASLLVYVADPQRLPGLVLFLAARPDAPLEHLKARLDGSELPVARAPDGTSLSIRLPPEALGSGLHRLSLETPMDSAEGSRIDYRRSCFRRLAYHFGERPVGLNPANAERLEMIAEHVAKGVSGSSHHRRSGTLFVGPGSRELLLDGTARRLHLDLDNASAATATFAAAIDDRQLSWQLEPGEQRAIELETPRRAHTLRLEVEGDALGLFLWGAPHVAEARSHRTPVILITLDTTRRDALSLYDDRGAPTPNLERFAEHATVYERAYSSSPWTLPSHASIFTGLHPSGHGAGVLSDHLLSEQTTLAELLRQAGYFTVGFAGGELCSSMWGLGQGFHFYSDPRSFEERGDYLVERVLDLLDGHRERHLFLFVNLFDPHALYDAPDPFPSRQRVDDLLGRVEHPDVRALSELDFEAWRRIVSGRSHPGAPDLPYLRASYLAEVAYADHQLGRIFDRLQERGLYDDALIVVTADHGESLGENGLFGHGARLGAEVLEVPLLVKLPGQTAGARSGALLSHVDLFALVAAIARGEPPVDLTRLARDRRSVLSEEHESIVHPFFRSLKLAAHLYAVHTATTRLVVWPGGSRCQQGGAGSWSDVPCERSWEESLQRVQQVAGTTPPATESVDALTQEQRERLRSLGYLP